MKIAYITTGNPFDKNSWSGTDYYVRKALEDQGYSVYCIFGYRYCNLHLIIKKIWAKFFRKNYQAIRSKSAAKKWAQYILSHLEEGTDAIFSLSTIPIAYLETKIPIYIYIDGIYEYMLNQGFKKIANDIKEAHLIEDLAIQHCTKVITTSVASAETIRNVYQSALQKIEIVPLGANLDTYPTKEEIIENLEKKDVKKCKILFVGVDWHRKGAKIVIDTVKLLHDQGFPIELHLVGLKDIPIKLEPYMINHGFLSKMKSDELNKLYTLYRKCHFLFVPSYAEAYGLVFCEANAFGVPSISHTVGGIQTIIKNNENGYLFNIGTKPEVFACYIKNTFNNKEEYNKLALSTYQRYCSYLNWNVSGKKLADIINNQKFTDKDKS